MHIWICLYLCLISLICSSYLILKLLPVWPTYIWSQERHLRLCTPLLPYLSTSELLLHFFFIVLLTLKATLILDFLKILVKILMRSSKYVNLTHILSSFVWVCTNLLRVKMLLLLFSLFLPVVCFFDVMERNPLFVAVVFITVISFCFLHLLAVISVPWLACSERLLLYD
jgi:hypothetical protein